MIKLNYILPDFLKTANNEIEAFIIPGDSESAGFRRRPTRATRGLFQRVGGGTPATAIPLSFNQNGQPFTQRAPNADDKAMIFIPDGLIKGSGQFFNVGLTATRGPVQLPRNSEFGIRLSSLLPIGNGLQASFIYCTKYAR